MPHLSAKTVKKKIYNRITREFIELIASVRTKDKTKALLRELLTPTEQAMLAKRLALIIMIKKGFSFQTIERALKVSPSTVVRFWKKTKTNTFPEIIASVLSKKARNEFWDLISDLIHQKRGRR